MSLQILYTILTLTALSSAAVIHQHDRGSKTAAFDDLDINNISMSALLLLSTPASPPEVEETHTVSKTDKTVLSSGSNAIMSKTDQISTSKTSPSATEVIDELDQTYASKQADEMAVARVNTVHDYAQGQHVNGVEDLYLKDEMNAVFAEAHPDGDKEMIGMSKSNAEEQISDPSGYDQTLLTVEKSDLHAVEDQDNFELTGNTKTELTYLGGTPDDVTSFYTIDEGEKHNLVRNAQGVERETKQSSITGLGFTDEVTESLALDETQNTIKIDHEGLQASVGVGKTNGLYNSMDWEGNKEVIEIDETAHKINVKDGDIGVSLNTNDMNNLYGFKDQDGSVGGYEGNGTEHSVTIIDGELTANFDLNNIDELFGISTPEGNDDVHKISQAGKSLMIDDGERGVAMGANEVNELHGVFDKGEVQERYQGNQVDKIVAVSEGSSGGSRQTSEINGVYQVKDDAGNMQTVATGGQMVGQTVVISDDHVDGGGKVDELFWLTSMEAPGDYGGQMSESSRGLDLMYGLITPKPEYQISEAFIIQQEVVAIAQDDNPYGVSGGYRGLSGANGGPEASGLGGLKDLVEKLDHLHEVGDLGRIENVFGGGKKSKINMHITIDMEI